MEVISKINWYWVGEKLLVLAGFIVYLKYLKFSSLTALKIIQQKNLKNYSSKLIRFIKCFFILSISESAISIFLLLNSISEDYYGDFFQYIILSIIISIIYSLKISYLFIFNETIKFSDGLTNELENEINLTMKKNN